MLKNLTFTLFLVSPAFLSGENYFLPGTIWTQTANNIIYSRHSKVFELGKSMVINGEEVMPLMVQVRDNPPYTWAYIKTEGDKVYCRDIDIENPQWYLFYDFGLKDGESTEIYRCDKPRFEICGVNRIPIQCVSSSTRVNGLDLELMEIKYDDPEIEPNPTGPFPTYWIKGYGGLHGVEMNARIYDKYRNNYSIILDRIESNDNTIKVGEYEEFPDPNEFFKQYFIRECEKKGIPLDSLTIDRLFNKKPAIQES